MDVEFEQLDLSYESIFFHKKVVPEFVRSKVSSFCEREDEHNVVGLVIPYGKKYCAWFRKRKRKCVIVLLEMGWTKQTNRRSVTKIKEYYVPFCYVAHKALLEIFEKNGTVLYGTIPTVCGGGGGGGVRFLIEDILMWQGAKDVAVECASRFEVQLEYLRTFFEDKKFRDMCDIFRAVVTFSVPVMEFMSSSSSSPSSSVDAFMRQPLPYDVHHFQFRATATRSGNSNQRWIVLAPARTTPPTATAAGFTDNIIVCAPAPAPAPVPVAVPKRKIFSVVADSMCDTYLLSNTRKSRETGLSPCDDDDDDWRELAFIPNIATSKMMNRLFRETDASTNQRMNLDYIEESDDDEVFETTTMVENFNSATTMIEMECEYNMQFKKWVPLRPVV